MELHDIRKRIWEQLRGDSDKGRSPFALLQAASIGLDGGPNVRTIVLRGADEAIGEVRFYSDLRSPKIAEWRNDPRIALVGYDTNARTQLRMWGVARFADDATRLALWASIPSHGLLDYQSPVPPGQVLSNADEKNDATRQHRNPAPTSRAGFEHFAALQVRVDLLDWLDLSDNTRHQRACFRRDGEHWHEAWIAP